TTNTTSGNLFIVKHDSSGNALWATSTSGSNTTLSYCIVADACGNSYLSGKPYNNSLPITFDTITLQPPAGSADVMFIVKYDSSGHVLFGKILPSGGDD